MLAEGVVAEAQNVTVQEADEEQSTPFDEWWVILLIVVVAICLVGVCIAVIMRMKSSGKDDLDSGDP